MERTYDVVVIGAGPAGRAAASSCIEHELGTAMVDVRTSYGGVCPLRGCNPKKVLVDVAMLVKRKQDLDGKGIEGDIAVNWQKLMAFKRTFTEDVPEKVITAYQEKGIDTYFGRAVFLDPERVRVGDTVLKAKHFVVASGSVPRKLDIPGEEHIITSDDFLDMDKLPPSLLFIGGGYVSCEFACVAALAGAKVQIVIRSERALREFDADLVKLLIASLEELGVEVIYNTPVVSVEKEGETFVFHGGKGGLSKLRAHAIMNGAGRVADIEDLNLDRAGVQAGPGGVAVNNHMQSVTSPHVYAVGDVADKGFMLTPSADLEGKIAAHNIVHGNTREADFTGIPSTAFTCPPLARVGKCENQLIDEEVAYLRRFEETGTSFSSRKIGQEHSGYKLLVEEGSGNILGAHVLGHNAEEVINVFALAMRLGLTVDDLEKGMWTYPSYIYDIRHMLP